MFWLSYECFSILYDAFLLKSVISSHNRCARQVMPYQVTAVAVPVAETLPLNNAVSACTAAVHNFQNPIYTAAFCRSLPRAFSTFCAGHICDLDVVNSHLLQIFKFATVKLKVIMLDFLYLDIKNI